MARPTLLTIACAAGVVLAGAPRSGPGPAQRPAGFLPVGVRYQSADDPDVRRRDLEMMRGLRFNVVEIAQADGRPEAAPLMFLDRLLAGAPDPRVMLPLDPPAAVAIDARTDAVEVKVEAWTALARGAGGVIFADWPALLRNPDALAAATAFAEETSRNALLYAPLRPAKAMPGERLVRIVAGGDAIQASLLESPEALVLIAINRTDRQRTATLTFSLDVPEAIWQNMLGTGAVSFVAGPDGPVYERTFPPRDVLVLVIRKGRR